MCPSEKPVIQNYNCISNESTTNILYNNKKANLILNISKSSNNSLNDIVKTIINTTIQPNLILYNKTKLLNVKNNKKKKLNETVIIYQKLGNKCNDSESNNTCEDGSL